MAKRRPLCKCGHCYSKHGPYPLDYPWCKGKNLPKYHLKSCQCPDYEPLTNLEYLERKYLKSVGKNVKG